MVQGFDPHIMPLTDRLGWMRGSNTACSAGTKETKVTKKARIEAQLRQHPLRRDLQLPHSARVLFRQQRETLRIS